jgi:RNA polymerase sigma-70 factor (ECF subfamily)
MTGGPRGEERGSCVGRRQHAGPAGGRPLNSELLGDHIDLLYRVAWSMCGSREEAEDLVQETFAKVLLKPRILYSDDDVGYLLRVLKNTFLTQRRTAARRIQTAALPDTFDALEDPSAVLPHVRLESRQLYGLIAALPDSFRNALVAVDVAGLSYREAAHALGVREATLTTRLHRARQRIARELPPTSS